MREYRSVEPVRWISDFKNEGRFAPAIFREDGVCHGPSRWEETAASFSWVSFIDCFDLVPEYQPAHGTFPGASHGSRARRHVHGDGRGDDSCGTGQADGRQKGK